MIAHTTAFKQYRDLSQSHINFVVLVCHSVPFLRSHLAIHGSSVPKPDHFKGKGNTLKELATFANEYQGALARNTLITSFSYFEAYTKSAILEIFKFHGGEESFTLQARHRAGRFLKTMPDDVQRYKRKLQDKPNPAKDAKYKKYSHLLDERGFSFPTDLMAHFGAKQLALKTKGKSGFKAHDIEGILRDALLYPLSTTDSGLIEEIRSARNRVAHGASLSLTLPKSLRYASSLHSLVATIDAHIVNHFLLVQRL